MTSKRNLAVISSIEFSHLEAKTEPHWDHSGSNYQKGKLDADGFAKFHEPLVERQKQIEASIPRLEAELDILKVNTLSAEEVSRNAKNLAGHWADKSQEEKLEMVELITERITVGEGELEIAFLYSPSGKDAAEKERKGRDSNPRNLAVQRFSRPPR